MTQIKNRTTLITGGTRGIGKAISLRLARENFSKIIINYGQDDAAAIDTRRELEKIGVACHAIRANLASPAAIDELFAAIRGISPTIDAYVHCAALGAFKPLAQVKPNQWDLSMSINARSFVQCVQKCRSMMKGGSIIAISSLGGRLALPNYGAIGPSKAALEAAVRQFAAELGSEDIRVNAVAGGFIETDSLRRMPNYEVLCQVAVRSTPLGRIGKPEDIADIVAFMLSPQASWIHGQVIIADGGASVGMAACPSHE